MYRTVCLVAGSALLLSVACGDDDKGMDSAAGPLNGVITTPDDHGGTKMTTYVDGVKQGEFVWLRDDGGEYQRGMFVDGEKSGVWIYDDIVIRFDTHFESGNRCGEERRFEFDGESLVLVESTFYLDNDRAARGEWRCSDSDDCVRWSGIWFERETDETTGEEAVLARTYEDGEVTGEVPIEHATTCHFNVF